MKRLISLLLALLLIVSVLPIPSTAADEPVSNALVLPAALQEVDDHAFADNTSINTVVVPNGVTSIGAGAFEGCTGITEVTIASRSISIAWDAFKDCSRDTVFYTHNDSSAMVWALLHGFKWVSLDDEAYHLDRFLSLVSHSGYDPSMLMDDTFASSCLIIRTSGEADKLPDISAYNPVDVFRSDGHLYYVQFDTPTDTEACYTMLRQMQNSGQMIANVEPDRLGSVNDVFAQSVTVSEYWGGNDTMGFDVYAPFVASHYNGSNVTIAVIDSGVKESSWGGTFSRASASFVGGSPYTDTANHGSKVASIIGDCVGQNKSHITLLPIKIVNNGSMYRTSVIIEGIKHATNNSANIINLSLGWDVGESPELEYRLSLAQSKGILIVAAAGNGSGRVMYPARCGGVLAVSALTYSNETGYSVSSRTGSEISYTAPGMHLSTSAHPDLTSASDYLGMASTSFATPQITAALALIKMDGRKSGGAVSVLNSCCMKPEDVPSSHYGKGMPKLEKLAVIEIEDIILKNINGGLIPDRLWLGDHDNDFMLGWELAPSDTTERIITIESSDPDVLSVSRPSDDTACIRACGKGTATITVSCGKITKQFDIVVQKPVTEIIISGTDSTIIVGKELDLAVAVLEEDADNKAVSWHSQNEDVIEVSQTGHIIAKAVGTSIITCTAMDLYEASASLEMTVLDIPDPTGVGLFANGEDITNGDVELEIGDTLPVAVQVLPEDALQTWAVNASSGESISIIEPDPEGFTIEAQQAGDTTVTVTATEASDVYAELNVSVVIKPVSLTISAERTTLDEENNTVQLAAEVFPEDTTEKYQTITWSSRSPSIVEVNSNTGFATAVSSGWAEIVATTVNGIEETITIEVRRPITITFDAQEGNGTETERRIYSGDRVGNLPEATRQYYTLGGWYTTQKSGGTKVYASRVFTDDTTLYARWIGNSYAVSFDANEGTCDTQSMTAMVGNKLYSLPTATREHYSFTGWYTAAEGGTKVTPDYVQNHDTNLTLYAQWSAHPYTIRFNANGGNCTTETMTATVDTPVGSLPVASRNYYTFDGWFTAITGGIRISEDYTQSTTTETVAYAHWTPMKYVMTFVSNGGSVIEAREYDVDADIGEGEPPEPVRAYYAFEGWYIEGAESSTHVTSTYRQSTTNPVTVCARWRALPYEMTFDANGGSCGTASKTGYVDNVIGTLPTPSRNYYDFLGWYTPSGTEVAETYIQGTTDDITVYAYWKAHKYTMSFNPNGGNCDEASRQCTVDVAAGMMPVPTLAYHTFTGWYTAAEGGTEITDSFIQRSDENITVFAQWTPNKYTITLNANNGNCSVASVQGTVGRTIGTLPTPSRNYYLFDGWYKSDNTRITESYLQNNDTSFTVYAHWSPQEYTMLFDVNDNHSATSYAEVNPGMKQCLVDTPVGVLPTPTRVNYDFDAWYTAAAGGTKVTSAFTHGSTNSITVYAHWIPHTFKLTFNTSISGAICSTPSKLCTVDAIVSTLPTPTLDYHTFDGWYTSASGGTQVTASTVFTSDTDVTIYAHWTQKPIKGWVTQSQIPAGAQIVQTSWSYRISTESESSSMDGWVANGDYWKQTGTGSAEYASFPSGEYDTNNKYYKEMAHAPYTASESATNKREVVNSSSPTGYIYWHWAINGTYSPTAHRVIAYKKGTYSDGYWYGYFYAIKSTTKCPKASSDYCTIGQYPKNGRTTYNCTTLINDTSLVPAADKTNSKSGLKTYRFYELAYYTSTYTDYVKTYRYYKDLTYQPTDPGNGSNISNKVTYYKYREK